MRNNEVQAHGIPLFCQVISYIGKVDFRKKKKQKTMVLDYKWFLFSGFCSIALLSKSAKLQVSDARNCVQTS